MSDTKAPAPDKREPRPKKREVNGWLVLDKGVGMTSTHAVAVVKRAFNAKKAGHAGTLDPLASGILPIALGEATKTVPFVMDGRKSYVFTVAWGVETDTDDAEGRPIQATHRFPERAEVEALLPRFTGEIEQTPPRFSAIKIQGERAYDLAREGEAVELQPRTVEIARLAVMKHSGERSILEAECGKGTYVRALARDLGRALGCLGHVAALRRTRVGPFCEEDAVTVAEHAPEARIGTERADQRPRLVHIAGDAGDLVGRQVEQRVAGEELAALQRLHRMEVIAVGGERGGQLGGGLVDQLRGRRVDHDEHALLGKRIEVLVGALRPRQVAREQLLDVGGDREMLCGVNGGKAGKRQNQRDDRPSMPRAQVDEADDR